MQEYNQWVTTCSLIPTNFLLYHASDTPPPSSDNNSTNTMQHKKIQEKTIKGKWIVHYHQDDIEYFEPWDLPCINQMNIVLSEISLLDDRFKCFDKKKLTMEYYPSQSTLLQEHLFKEYAPYIKQWILSFHMVCHKTLSYLFLCQNIRTVGLLFESKEDLQHVKDIISNEKNLELKHLAHMDFLYGFNYSRMYYLLIVLTAFSR
jgi:hypothetical protein